jgi:hypothetical protein
VYRTSETVRTVARINCGACESAVSATDVTVPAVAARLQYIHIHTKAIRPCMMYGSGGHNAIRTNSYMWKNRKSKFLVKSTIEQSTNLHVSGGKQCCYRTFDLNENVVLAVNLPHKVRLPQSIRRVTLGINLCFTSVMDGRCLVLKWNCVLMAERKHRTSVAIFISFIAWLHVSMFCKTVIRQIYMNKFCLNTSR